MTDITIPDLLARATAVRAAAAGLPDAIRGDVANGAWHLEVAALRQPAGSLADLESKLTLWDALVEDPPSILEQHVALWAVLRDDIRRLAPR